MNQQPTMENNQNASSPLSTASILHSNYAIYQNQAQFEQSMNHYLSQDSTGRVQFEDSLIQLGIMPLSRTPLYDHETWLGLENIASLLNRDNLIQIGDSIIKIDKVNNVAYVLTPAAEAYLPSLKNNELVEGHIYLHETLEKPIFEEYEDEEGFGKKRGVCRDATANQFDRLSYSWNGASNANVWTPPIGTNGVKWRIRYQAAGIYFSILTRAVAVARVLNGGIVEMGFQSWNEDAYNLHWIQRCRNSANPIRSGRRLIYSGFEQMTKEYESLRALTRYRFIFWASHDDQGTARTAFHYPMEISSGF